MLDIELFIRYIEELKKYICKILGVKYPYGSDILFINDSKMVYTYEEATRYRLYMYLVTENIEDEKIKDIWKKKSINKLLDVNVNYLGMDKSRIVYEYKPNNLDIRVNSYVDLTEDELMNIFALCKISN